MSAEEFHEPSHKHHPAREGEENYIDDPVKAEMVATAVDSELENWETPYPEQFAEAQRYREYAQRALSKLEPMEIDGLTGDEIDNVWQELVEDKQSHDDWDEPSPSNRQTRREAYTDAQAMDAESKAKMAKVLREPTNHFEAFYDKYQAYFANRTTAEFIQDVQEYENLGYELKLPEGVVLLYSNLGAIIDGALPALEGADKPSGEAYTDDEKEGAEMTAKKVVSSMLDIRTTKDVEDFWFTLNEGVLPHQDVADFTNSEIIDASLDQQLVDRLFEVAKQANENYFNETPKQQYERFIAVMHEAQALATGKLEAHRQTIRDLENKFSGVEQNEA